MKYWILTLLFAVLVTPSTAQDTFTDAKEVLKASYEKTGGDKWKEVNTMIMSTSISVAAPGGDIFGTVKVTNKYPGYSFTKVLLEIPPEMGGQPGGMTQTQVMTPDTTISKSDFGGNHNEGGGNGPKSASQTLTLLMNDEAELSLSQDSLEGRPMYVVTSVVDSTTTKHFFDMETLLRSAMINVVPQGEVTTVFSDYKEVDGLTMPYKTKQQMNGMDQIMKIKSVTINPEVADSVFDH